ncbi:MAG: hypothetical protein H6719_30525 [Sandaracinaceae bacterium]|nr:hypothetical protein [Sandaracinaceae bacterium]
MRAHLIDLAIALAVGGVVVVALELASRPPALPIASPEQVRHAFDEEVRLARELGFEDAAPREIPGGSAPWTEDVPVEADDCLAVVVASDVEHPVELSLEASGGGVRGARDTRDAVQHAQLCATVAGTVHVAVEAAPRPSLHVAILRADVLSIGGEVRLNRPATRHGWSAEQRAGHERALARARADARGGDPQHDVRVSRGSGVPLLPRTEASCVAAQALGVTHVEGEPCPDVPADATPRHVTRLQGVGLRVLAILDPEGLGHAADVELLRLRVHDMMPALAVVGLPLDGRQSPRVRSVLAPGDDAVYSVPLTTHEMTAIAVQSHDVEDWAVRVSVLGDPLEGPLRGAVTADAPSTPSERCSEGDGASCGLVAWEAHRVATEPIPEEVTRLYARGCDLGDGRSCSALGILAGRSVPLFARGCFAGYATACWSAIHHARPASAEWRIEEESWVPLRLVTPPPDDRRVRRVGDTLPTECGLATYAGFAAQIVCGDVTVYRAPEVESPFARLEGAGAQLFGDLPRSGVTPGSIAERSFSPLRGLTYVVPRAALGDEATPSPGDDATTASEDGVLFSFDPRDRARTLWMDQATHRAVLWLGDLPAAELTAREEG